MASLSKLLRFTLDIHTSLVNSDMTVHHDGRLCGGRLCGDKPCDGRLCDEQCDFHTRNGES